MRQTLKNKEAIYGDIFLNNAYAISERFGNLNFIQNYIQNKNKLNHLVNIEFWGVLKFNYKNEQGVTSVKESSINISFVHCEGMNCFNSDHCGVIHANHQNETFTEAEYYYSYVFVSNKTFEMIKEFYNIISDKDKKISHIELNFDSHFSTKSQIYYDNPSVLEFGLQIKEIRKPYNHIKYY